MTKSGQKAALQDAAAAIGLAAPTSPVDETKVPHYFGPFPNWANSPFTLPDVTVAIDASPLEGTDPTAAATATATVGAGGAVTGITITNPGFGYAANPAVNDYRYRRNEHQRDRNGHDHDHRVGHRRRRLGRRRGLHRPDGRVLGTAAGSRPPLTSATR